MRIQFLALLLLMIFFVKTSMAQLKSSPGNNTTSFYTIERIANRLQVDNIQNNGSSVLGTPYFNKEYTSAVFYLKDQPKVESPTRLNLYNQHFEFIKEDTIFFVNPDVIDSVRLSGKRYEYKRLKSVSDTTIQLLQKIEGSELYKLSVVVFKPEVKPGVYVTPEPARFILNDPVYVLGVKQGYVVLSNFNNLYRSFPDNKNVLKKFIKKNKIRKDDEEGLSFLIDYIDNL